jgi:hypothetical protein
MNRLVACSCWQQPPRRACSCSWSKLCHLPQFHRGRHAFPWQGVQQCADACCSPCCFWERSDCSVRGICAALPPMAWRCLPDGCAPMVTATPQPFCEPRSFRRWCRAVHRWPGVLDHPALASLAHPSRRGSTATCADPASVDGQRKPVYSDVLLPRGLIGWLGVVLGCRALLVLHDEHGHPLFATTHRGDQHLTAGVPAFLER